MDVDHASGGDTDVGVPMAETPCPAWDRAMPPRRRPTAQLLTPAGWAGLLAVAGLAAIAFLALSGLFGAS